MKRKILLVGAVLCVISLSLVLISGCAKSPAIEEEVIMTGETKPEARAVPEVTEEELTARARAEKEAVMKEASSFSDIYFAYDRYDLGADSRQVLGDLADWMLEHSNFEVTIEGHCDERGTTEYNLALGERRAEAASAYLVNLGVDRRRITTISYGEELPLDPAHNEKAWSKNRRDHFVVFPKN